MTVMEQFLHLADAIQASLRDEADRARFYVFLTEWSDCHGANCRAVSADGVRNEIGLADCKSAAEVCVVHPGAAATVDERTALDRHANQLQVHVADPVEHFELAPRHVEDLATAAGTTRTAPTLLSIASTMKSVISTLSARLDLLPE
jgi:hypothetical protein